MNRIFGVMAVTTVLAVFTFAMSDDQGITMVDQQEASAIFGAHDGCSDGHAHVSATKGCSSSKFCKTKTAYYVHGVGYTSSHSITCPQDQVFTHCGAWSVYQPACAEVEVGQL